MCGEVYRESREETRRIDDLYWWDSSCQWTDQATDKAVLSRWSSNDSASTAIVETERFEEVEVVCTVEQELVALGK